MLFSRPINPGSVRTSVGASGEPITLELLDENDQPVMQGPARMPLTWTSLTNHELLRYGLSVTVGGTLAANKSYTLRISGVTDDRGGRLLIPFNGRFRTGGASSKLPVVASVTPRLVSLQGGHITLVGSGFGTNALVRIGGTEVDCANPATECSLTEGDTRLTLKAPSSDQPGPADVVVRDPGGPRSELPSGVFYLDDLVGAHATLLLRTTGPWAATRA